MNAATRTDAVTLCNKRHRPIWSAISVLLLLAGVILVIVGWSWIRSDVAFERAGAAEAAIRENHMETSTSFSFIRDGLQRIESEQAEQRKLLNDLSRGVK